MEFSVGDLPEIIHVRHWIIKSHVFVKDTGFPLIGVCPLPWSCISNAEGLSSDGSSHTHFCVFTAVHRLNSWWLAEFRIRQSSRGTKPSCRCMRAVRGLETLLVGFVCEHTPLQTHTHTLRTRTPCEHTCPANKEKCWRARHQWL